MLRPSPISTPVDQEMYYAMVTPNRDTTSATTTTATITAIATTLYSPQITARHDISPKIRHMKKADFWQISKADLGVKNRQIVMLPKIRARLLSSR